MPSAGAPSFLASRPLPLCGLPAGYKPKLLGGQSSCLRACPPRASSCCWPSSSPLSPLGVEPLFPRTHSVVCLAVLVPGKFCSAFSSLVRPVFQRSPPWRFQPSPLSPSRAHQLSSLCFCPVHASVMAHLRGREFVGTSTSPALLSCPSVGTTFPAGPSLLPLD